MSAWELLKDGMPWQAARTAIEFSLGTLSWAILGGFLITAVYFSTESLRSTGFITFLLLFAATLFFDISSIGIIFLLMVVFVALALYDVFIA